MEIEEHKTIWKSEDEDSMVAATVGRVMTTVLTARPTKLIDSISRLQSSPNPNNSLALSLENSLRILHKYVRDGAEKEESLDEVLIPMIEHSLRSKDSKHKNQEMILINWLFQDEVLFQALARKFSDILLRKEDRHIALGWCILARRLIDYDVTMSRFSVTGIKERYTKLLENLCLCSGHLMSLINNGSTLQGGFELPTRLSAAAADCIIALSVALAKKEMDSNPSKDKKKLSKSSQQIKPISQTSEITRDMEMRLLLWNLVDHLIMLVQRLLAWSKKSRSLHAKGLERVLKWLRETKKQYHSSQDQAGQRMVKTGMLLLSSCWKHYGVLLHLEDHQISSRYKELLDQYLSGIEYYAGNYTKDQIDANDSGISTINFFLNCLLLLLGRFSSKQFDTVMMEHRVDITRVVASQLCSADDDVIDGAVSILKATIFGTNHLQSGSNLTDNKQMKSVLPLLLNLLDERDGTARAIVILIAEYCSMSEDRYCLDQILKRLASENINHRRNALDVISEVINISSDSPSNLSHPVWQDISNHLLDCLKDEEDPIRAHADKLLTLVDPSLVLPALVNLIYSSDATLSSSSTTTLLRVLTSHNQKPEVISLLLDCLSNLDASLDHQKTAENYIPEGFKGDVDKVLKLIPEWSRSVENWKLLVGPLVDKMFAEPSNPIMVKFLSYISEYLGATADIIFQQILLHTESQTEIGENFMSELDISGTENDIKLQHSLFNRLCPLLLIRLLPLKVFNDQKSSLVYADLLGQNNNIHDISETRCIASLLLKRTFNKFEFEDVRKLSAELCGRLHPNVFFPAVSSELERATNDHDILKIKACLFAVCTSLVVRGVESVDHPGMSRVRESIKTVLLWPSIDGDEISKAQHGCIDCLAIALCTEFQAPKPSKKKSIIQTGNSGTITFQAYVLDLLTFDEQNIISSNGEPLNQMSEKQLLSFRLCMANVLISACQKISDSAKKLFASKILQRIIHSVNNVKEPEIRAACIQVLFSIVYHLKSIVLPYSSDLLKASLESLKRGSEMERMGGAKLLASLMASEEVIVQRISEGLLEAKTLLLDISQTDSSPSVRQLCSQLLACMTST
ncbi:putative armadillo-like helical protein [Helianthus anomalus]